MLGQSLAEPPLGVHTKNELKTQPPVSVNRPHEAVVAAADERQDEAPERQGEAPRELETGDVRDTAEPKRSGFSLWSWVSPGPAPVSTTPTEPVVKHQVAPKKVAVATTGFWSEILRLIDPEASSPRDDEQDQDEESLASTKDGSTRLLGDLQSVPSDDDEDECHMEDSLKTSDLGKADDATATTAADATIVEHAAKKINAGEKGDEGKQQQEGEKEESMVPDKTPEEKKESRRTVLVKELRDAVSNYGRYHVRCADASAALGDLLMESGQKEQAIKLHKDAVTIYSCKLGDDNEITLNAKVRLGQVLEESGLYDEAISLYYLVTAMRRSLLSDEDPIVADGYVMMSEALRKKCDYLQAIKELKRALKIYREALGDSNEKVAKTVDEIASLYVTTGDYEKSAAILEEVVKLKAATHGAGHTSVAESLCSLATTYECSSHYDKAMKALKKAYKIYTQVGGYASEDSTSVLGRMAKLYEDTEDNHRAAIAYLGVLRGRKVNSGPASLIVGETYYRLGRVLRRTDQLDKALKCMKEALPLFVNKAVEINDAEMIAEIMHEMALINKDRKNHVDSARIFKQELSVRRKIGQPEFPMIARTLNHLGVAEFELTNYTKSLKNLVEALNIFQKHGAESLDCAEVLFNTGLVFEAVKNDDRSLEAFTEAARIFKSHKYDSDHPHLVKALYKAEKIQQKKRGLKSPKSKSESSQKGSSVMKRLFK